MQPIQGLGPLLPSHVVSSAGSAAVGGPRAASTGGPSFKEILLNSLERAHDIEQQAKAAAEQLAAGGDANQPAAKGAMQKADAALRTVTQVRDALLGAYNEIKDLRI
jgi:flagellar hook-basal body complex protein FliE